MDEIPVGCMNARSARLGLYEGEPLLVIADALLSYAKAYKARFGDMVGKDRIFAPAVTDMLAGLKALLDGDGAVANRRGIVTDSKDNSCLSQIIEATCEAAGIDFQEL